MQAVLRLKYILLPVPTSFYEEEGKVPVQVPTFQEGGLGWGPGLSVKEQSSI